jgi:nitrogenase molybdenum-cofactor synthesis protein NifE
MLELVRQLALTIESPVWEAVRAPAPWKSHLPPRFDKLRTGFAKGGNAIEEVTHG